MIFSEGGNPVEILYNMATSSESESLSEITIQNLKNRELFQ